MRRKSMLICQYTRYCYRPGSIQADAFRGHGLSLLAPARGMSTLSAKDGFSRPSLKNLRLRLLVTLRSMLPRRKGAQKFTQVVPSLWGLRTRAIPAGQGRLRQLLHRTKKIVLYFRGVTALLSPGLVKLFTEEFFVTLSAKEFCY